MNVPNCTGETAETTRNRMNPHHQSNASSTSSSGLSTPLHSIIEEDKRRNIIHQLGGRDASDRLKIYRSTNDMSDDHKKQELNNVIKSNECIPNSSSSNNNNKQIIYIKSQTNTEPTISQHSKPKVMITSPPTPTSPVKISIKPHLSYHPLNNNIEIDSDNIETPPVVRRNISARGLPPDSEIIEKKNMINPTDQEILGDGQFDRFSSARRTRRYKRPVDYSSGTEEKTSEYQHVKLHESETVSQPVTKEKPKTPVLIKSPLFEEDKESRLKRWQEKLMHGSEDDLIKTKLNRIGRHLTSINQKDVQDAIQNLKSPTEIPEIISFERRQSQDLHPIKPIMQELNDEGFEETQSLVSDTPSQGKESTSSCNDVPDGKVIEPAQAPRVNALKRHGSERLPKRTTKPLSHNLITKNQDLIQNRTIRGTPISTSSSSGSVRREGLIRKSDLSSPSLLNNIERSSSRGSLRSSRSSLNSGISTSTIKKMPSKLSTLKKSQSADSPVTKRPLNVQNSFKSNVRVPASRSSSSGSSIGPNQTRRPASSLTSSPSKILSSASFKENRKSSTAIQQTRSSSSSNVPSAQQSPIKSPSSLSQSTSSSARRTGGFMRPTTASATKVNGVRGK